MIGIGDFILDAAAKRADDIGSSEEVGTRGVVVRAYYDWPHPTTGEPDTLLVVATRHHGHLEFVDVAASDVADSWPCGRIDAGGYISVCQREVSKARRGNVDSRVVELLALVTRIKESPASPYIGRPDPPAAA